MSYQIFTDTAANLPCKEMTRLDIRVLTYPLELGGERYECPVDLTCFDYKRYYDALRAGTPVKTSLINQEVFMDAFRPVLEGGEDVVYIGLSSGVSGTVHSARLAAERLCELYPGRHVEVIDSLGAGLGIGLVACRAADLRAQGMELDALCGALTLYSRNMRQYFTVDDMMFLRRGGRVSGVKAILGTVLQIKPILYGDEEGHIVMINKARGRRDAIARIAALYRETAVDPQHNRVAISHGDCEADAMELAERICEIARPGELIVSVHEPMTGAHVGPGMLALFFQGEGR